MSNGGADRLASARPVASRLVHFPAALFPTSLLFDVLSLRFEAGQFVAMAFYSMAVGEAVGLVAATAGAIDYFTKPCYRDGGVGTIHGLLNVSILLLYGFNLGLRLGPPLEMPRTPAGPLVLSTAGVIVLTVSKYLGGLLVYRHGVGVRRTR